MRRKKTRQTYQKSKCPIASLRTRIKTLLQVEKTPEILEDSFGFVHRLLLTCHTMLVFIRLFVLVAPVALAAPFIARSHQGQPVSVARTADRTVEATALFGTTTDSPNFTQTPTALCIVPKYADEAGLGKEKAPLIAQQALDLCPGAERIAVCDN
ncbi:hypothetical protein ACGC1H_000055 [Rhizoctonia solani]|uniref:Uncharacterized protein n=1 Tax=Rhizoctonia solani TaxID=456999 RepID=A0A8H3BZM3_9AGAM|nr:unnamed protein product [Rhizoctonia solani]